MLRSARRALPVALLLATAAAVLPVSPARAAPTSRDGLVRSFDDTAVVYTLHLPDGASAANPVPVVFMTHGWGGTRATAVTGDVATLVNNGYAVMSWDQRGFGDSGGEAQVDSQDFEVKDVQALIDEAARQPEIQLDAAGDPRMGMLGGSYAGGIQLMTASADRRVDAIVPQIPWHDLPQALKPGGVLKLGWDLLLYGAGAATAAANGLDAAHGPETGIYAPEIHKSFVEGTALNDWLPETLAWFDARSPKHYISGTATLPGISAPTLVMQGVSDTLFPLNAGVGIYNQVRANGTPAKLFAFCGGHTIYVPASSCTGAAQGARQRELYLAWFDRYVRGNDEAEIGSPIEYQLQDGSIHGAGALPPVAFSGTGGGLVANTVAPLSGTALGGTPSPDGIRVAVNATAGSTLLGLPTVTGSADVTGVEAYLFFKLVDIAPDGSETVIDDQVMALKVPGGSNGFTLDLAGISWKVEAGHRIELDVSPTSADHASARTPFAADVDVTVKVPAL